MDKSELSTAWLKILFAALVVGLNGCSTVWKPDAASAVESAVDTINGQSGDHVTETTSQDNVPRQPPVDSASVVLASAEIPLYYGKAGTNSFDSDVMPIQSRFEHKLPLATEQPLRIEHDSTANLSEIRRVPSVVDDDLSFGNTFQEQWNNVRSDHAEFYSLNSLTWLTVGVGAAAVMANTGFDENFVRNEYKKNVLQAPSDEYAKQLGKFKSFGNGYYTIPIFAIAALSGPFIEELPLGEATADWGGRSLRTVLIGAPPMLSLQVLTGGSRPGETTATSFWKPFDDNNGASGHAFMGAIPFISAAKMSDNIWLKGGLYAASTLPALSRVNDDDHYFSQIFLGWWVAYLAGSAIDRTDDANRNHRFLVYPVGDGIGAGVEYVH